MSRGPSDTAAIDTLGELHAATDLHLELGAMCARASTASAGFVGNSVHVSTERSGHEHPKTIRRNQGAAATSRLPLLTDAGDPPC